MYRIRSVGNVRAVLRDAVVKIARLSRAFLVRDTAAIKVT